MTYEDIAFGFNQNVCYKDLSKRCFMIICFSRCLPSCFFTDTIRELTIQLSNPLTNLNIRQSYLADRYCIGVNQYLKEHTLYRLLVRNSFQISMTSQR